MADKADWLYNLTRDAIGGMGFELVDVRDARQGRRRLLQFFIDAPGGVSVEDCAEISRELSYLLDAEQEFDDGYVLEVSSPGLDHDLRREREYRHFVGRTARLVLKNGERGGAVVGSIVSAEDGVVVLETGEGERVSVPFDDVVRARLVIEGF
jgi:ribosome maturation factor RimP